MAARPAGRIGWYRYIPFGVLLFFLGAAFYYQARLEARATVGEAAPGFSLPDLGDSEVALADFQGKAVVVNFWTTWCPECTDEMPALEAIHRAYGDRVAVLGVNMREPRAVVAPFVERLGVSYPVLLDRSERVAKQYRVTGVPETWIIAPDGTAALHRLGPMSYDQLAAALDEILAKHPGGPGGGST